jgi:hypothetical protein
MLHEILTADASVPTLVAWANAALLGAVGLVNLTALLPCAAPTPLGDFGPILRDGGFAADRSRGLLLTPDLRIWGIVLAAVIAFGTVVLLLDAGATSSRSRSSLHGRARCSGALTAVSARTDSLHGGACRCSQFFLTHQTKKLEWFHVEYL